MFVKEDVNNISDFQDRSGGTSVDNIIIQNSFLNGELVDDWKTANCESTFQKRL